MNNRRIEPFVLTRWTTDMEIDFIMLVEKKPHLWDPRHEHYTKKTLKYFGYREISAALQERWPAAVGLFTHERLINKFSNLRNYYRKESRKLQEKRLSSGDCYHSKWEHFTRLSFLNQVNEIGENSLDCNSPLELCDVSMPSEQVILPDAELDSTDQGEDTSTLKLTISSATGYNGEEDCKQRTGFKRRLFSDESSCDTPTTSQKIIPDPQSSSQAVNASSSSQGKRVTSDGDSLDDIFGKILVLTLKEIPESAEKELARIRIMEILMKLKYPHE